MKKNVLTENRIKGTKGFYMALGISAVMIGTACLFAYSQGEQLADAQLSAELSTPAVDKKYDNVPKPTTTMTAYVVNVTPVTTAPTRPVETMPIEEVIIETPEEEFQEVIAEEENAEEAIAENDTAEAVETAVSKLENVKLPLADISDVITAFSGTDLVKNETTGSWQTHNGTDFGAEAGTEVYAVSNGEITSVKKDALWGVTVVLDHHNGFVTKYCNLAEDLSVQEGDTLVSGDIIGLVGQTADIESALPPHLHMEITHNGTFTDPLSVIQ